MDRPAQQQRRLGNNFWLEPGDRVAIVNGEWRSSLIVDPLMARSPR
jgi:hypothetical protein